MFELKWKKSCLSVKFVAAYWKAKDLILNDTKSYTMEFKKKWNVTIVKVHFNRQATIKKHLAEIHKIHVPRVIETKDLTYTYTSGKRGMRRIFYVLIHSWFVFYFNLQAYGLFTPMSTWKKWATMPKNSENLFWLGKFHPLIWNSSKVSKLILTLEKCHMSSDMCFDANFFNCTYIYAFYYL